MITPVPTTSYPGAAAERAPTSWRAWRRPLACCLLLLGLSGPYGRVLAQQLAPSGEEPISPNGPGIISHKLVVCTNGTIKGWGLNDGGSWATSL